MTKSSASSVVVPSSLFVTELINKYAQFLNATPAVLFPAIVILPFTKMYASLKS